MSLSSRCGTAVALVASVGLASAAAPAPPPPQAGSPPVFTYRIVNTHPHDPRAYTQGLIYKDGFLYESTGRHGESSIRKVRLETGQVLQQHDVDAKYFGEGMTDWRGSLLQLTWKAGLGFVYDLASFKPARTFAYSGEGWGLTHDSTRLIMSDGSARLRFLDPVTFRETGSIDVRDRARPVWQLNELEFIKGEIYANVWQTERIARISPTTGDVLGWVDLTGIWPGRPKADQDAVLNGIAYDAAGDRLFVTGKWWPHVYEITLALRR
jgi:glutamine cyclotransferase